MYNDVSVMYIPFSSPSKKYIGYPMGNFWDARTTANRLFQETHRWNHALLLEQTYSLAGRGPENGEGTG